HVVAAAAAENDGVDDDTLGVVPRVGDGGALAGGDGEPRVGVRRGQPGRGVVGVALPVGEVVGGLIGEALPPHVAVVTESDVGEDGVAPDGVDGGGVGTGAGAGGDAEESCFGCDGAQERGAMGAQPGDVVAVGFELSPGDGWLQQGEVGLAARGGEGGGEVEDAAAGVGDFEDEHVLGEPALVAGDDGGDAEGEGFFGEERVAAVGGSVRPDFAGPGEVGDVF